MNFLIETSSRSKSNSINLKSTHNGSPYRTTILASPSTSVGSLGRSLCMDEFSGSLASGMSYKRVVIKVTDGSMTLEVITPLIHKRLGKYVVVVSINGRFLVFYTI